jgi:uncharacterized protein (DUF952 family)
MRPTYHLVPEAVWAASDPVAPYAAASLGLEGFIHCTDGADELGATFDRHFATDPRSFLALTVDLEATGSPWRFAVAGSPYPHIYGPIARTAIRAAAAVVRDGNGRYLRLGEPIPI